MTTSESLRDILGSAVTYAASLLGYMFSELAHWPWMQIGAAVLLLSRLLTDVPRAYHSLKHLLKKHDK